MSEQTLKGIPASDGIAIGPAFCLGCPDLSIPPRAQASVEEELARYQAACEQADRELQVLFDSIKERAGEVEAGIFEAHQMMLADPTLEQKVRVRVQAGEIVEQAVLAASSELASILAGMPDELFQARATDVRDVGQRILRILLGRSENALNDLTEPSIIVADDLTPSDTAGLDPKLTLGFVTVQGGVTSHSAILARTLGIPAIVGLGGSLLEIVNPRTPLALDGTQGVLVVAPGEEEVQALTQRKQERDARLRSMKTGSQGETRTANGRRVEVAANIGDPASAREAVENGAEGVGLLRTEFLYLEDTQPPDEEKQYRIYREIFDTLAGKPVIVRTLDIGGDKPPSYLPFPQEMNPFLGWRAIRISLDEPEMFKTQIRAILRAAAGREARIMFPMVSDLDELRRARALVEAVKQDLRQAGVEFSENVPVGIMVETPAAAVLVDVLAEAADFFSLGTNDLTQYTLAADRGNARVANLFQLLHPAVLRLVKQTIDLGHAKGKWVGMCGEMAGLRQAVPILLGLGLDEFSMNPRSIPEAKHLIRKLSDEQAQEIARQALSFGTAAEIEQFMKGVLASL